MVRKVHANSWENTKIDLLLERDYCQRSIGYKRLKNLFQIRNINRLVRNTTLNGHAPNRKTKTVASNLYLCLQHQFNAQLLLFLLCWNIWSVDPKANQSTTLCFYDQQPSSDLFLTSLLKNNTRKNLRSWFVDMLCDNDRQMITSYGSNWNT